MRHNSIIRSVVLMVVSSSCCWVSAQEPIPLELALFEAEVDDEPVTALGVIIKGELWKPSSNDLAEESGYFYYEIGGKVYRDNGNGFFDGKLRGYDKIEIGLSYWLNSTEINNTLLNQIIPMDMVSDIENLVFTGILPTIEDLKQSYSEIPELSFSRRSIGQKFNKPEDFAKHIHILANKSNQVNETEPKNENAHHLFTGIIDHLHHSEEKKKEIIEALPRVLSSSNQEGVTEFTAELFSSEDASERIADMEDRLGKVDTNLETLVKSSTLSPSAFESLIELKSDSPNTTMNDILLALMALTALTSLLLLLRVTQGRRISYPNPIHLAEFLLDCRAFLGKIKNKPHDEINHESRAVLCCIAEVANCLANEVKTEKSLKAISTKYAKIKGERIKKITQLINIRVKKIEAATKRKARFSKDQVRDFFISQTWAATLNRKLDFIGEHIFSLTDEDSRDALEAIRTELAPKFPWLAGDEQLSLLAVVKACSAFFDGETRVWELLGVDNQAGAIFMAKKAGDVFDVLKLHLDMERGEGGDTPISPAQQLRRVFHQVSLLDQKHGKPGEEPVSAAQALIQVNTLVTEMRKQFGMPSATTIGLSQSISEYGQALMEVYGQIEKKSATRSLSRQPTWEIIITCLSNFVNEFTPIFDKLKKIKKTKNESTHDSIDRLLSSHREIENLYDIARKDWRLTVQPGELNISLSAIITDIDRLKNEMEKKECLPKNSRHNRTQSQIIDSAIWVVDQWSAHQRLLDNLNSKLHNAENLISEFSVTLGFKEGKDTILSDASKLSNDLRSISQMVMGRKNKISPSAKTRAELSAREIKQFLSNLPDPIQKNDADGIETLSTAVSTAVDSSSKLASMLGYPLPREAVDYPTLNQMVTSEEQSAKLFLRLGLVASLGHLSACMSRGDEVQKVLKLDQVTASLEKLRDRLSKISPDKVMEDGIELGFANGDFHFLMRAEAILEAYFAEDSDLVPLRESLHLVAGSIRLAMAAFGSSVQPIRIFSEHSEGQRRLSAAPRDFKNLPQISTQVLERINRGEKDFIVDVHTFPIRNSKGHENKAKVLVANPADWR